jgi:non-heme chloroperoxidase
MRSSIVATTVFAFTTVLIAQDWTDPSPHSISRVPVAADVQLELLDWGGAGRSVLMLAGLGHTAHIFDDFATKLRPDYHVYGLTRRGYGPSSTPSNGYAADQLANDVASAIVAAKLNRPIVMGHSIAGEELTSLGANHPQLISGLIYLDAAWDRTNRSTEEAISQRLPHTPPTETDMRTVDSLRSWIQRTSGISLPEAEVRQAFRFTAAGQFIGPSLVPPAVPAAILAGVRAPDYERVRVPALAFYAVPRSLADIPGYRADDNGHQAAFQEMYRWQLQKVEASKRRFAEEVKQSRVVELPGASHYVFLSHERVIIAALREFVSGLQ